MLGYYLRLAAISIRKHVVMSLLMVMAIGLGIGICMTIVTVNYIMAKDPIPARSAQLFAVQLDGWDPNQPPSDDGYPPDQLTYLDAMALMAARQAHRQVATTGLSMVIEPEDAEIKPFRVFGRATFADFFAMFAVPFQYGGGWDAAIDDSLEQVVVLSREQNDKIFGGADSVGRSLSMNGRVFRVVGVLDEWQPIPRFYDLTTNPYADVAGVFIPFGLQRALTLPRSGNTNCWKPVGDEPDAFYASECIWIQFWAELPDRNAQVEYLAFLDRYAAEQKELGRFQRPFNNRISNVKQWLEQQEVVDDSARMMLPLAIMFLVVCLLNTIGLLLAKFLGRSQEIGLRRALGASKGTLFLQYLIESACIGLVGGLLGLLFTWLGLRGVRALFGDLVENLVQLDWVMVATGIALAITASVAAGLYPTWRACNVPPAGQLKT